MLLKESDMNNFVFRVNMSLHFNIIFCFFCFCFCFWVLVLFSVSCFFFVGGGGGRGVWGDGSNNNFSRPRPGWAFPRFAIAPCTLLCVCVRRIDTFLVNRAFSFTWQTAMQIFYDKRRRLHKKRVKLPRDWLRTPTWPTLHCFGNQHGGLDIIWKAL